MSVINGRQSGFTLIEVILSMAVFGMILILLGRVTAAGLTKYQYLQYQANGAADLGTLLDRAARVLRGATQVVDAQTNSVTVYAYFSPQDAVVKKVRYFTTGNTLKAGVTPPSGSAPNYTYNPANEVITTLTNNLTTSPNPIFTYYDATGAQLANGFSLAQVKQIGIYLSINPSPRYLPKSLQTGTRVTLRNVKTNL